MSRRRIADHYARNRVVMIRCHRFRRVLGRLSEGWFQPKRMLGPVKDPSPPVFTFPGQPKPFIHGRPMKGVTAIPLEGWTLEGVACGCRKRDGTYMTWTLNLHRMDRASSLDGRTHDLIAGMPDYGLTGIHDDLEYHVALDVAPDSISDAEIMARGATEASFCRSHAADPEPRSAQILACRSEQASALTVKSSVHRDTDDPVDRA
jgi:hypothetical protein